MRVRSARLAVELGRSKDQGSALAQEVSQLSRERGELDARLSEFKEDHASLTNELVEAKLELARLREMEVRVGAWGGVGGHSGERTVALWGMEGDAGAGAAVQPLGPARANSVVLSPPPKSCVSQVLYKRTVINTKKQLYGLPSAAPDNQ